MNNQNNHRPARLVLKCLFTALAGFCLVSGAGAQNHYELNTGWVCAPIARVRQNGTEISRTSFATANWLPATVPGTVLTTLLNNQLIPDPFYGMNNQKIPDIYATGPEHYTYWFVKDFKEKAAAGELVWLHLRGVNYSCEVYLNGREINRQTHYGMFLRQTYNITPFLSPTGSNRLAVIVYPPNPAGNGNGGQGGDGEIARNVSNQYVAGWDWIQPIRDRNTGIWDKVTIEKTRGIDLKNPHVVTLVPGKRFATGKQQRAILKASAEIENPGSSMIAGTLEYEAGDLTVKKEISIAPGKTATVQLPDLVVTNPRLWWPNGYGPQNLYSTRFRFMSKSKTILDEEAVTVGIRQIDTKWNSHTSSRETSINGQSIFIRGGNWIISDAMLRFTDERYDAEVRFHRDMNLNLIRIWGGAITERPEFYQACDKYGLLVFQDFWFSGDCNGKWLDPMKKEDQWTRRNYPDDHKLVLASFTDQVKMIRNHASLAFYCAGNEVTPPPDILDAIKDSILPAIDNTRYLFDYSNSDSMSYNNLGGNGDGPYGIQNINTFWAEKTFPFNSEVGSVGAGDYESLERFIPAENLVAPQFVQGKNVADSVWDYHKYIGYDGYINAYGKAKNARDFGNKAQLINYDQYRGLIEGFSAHSRDWYTGVIIWKTQNPWTALRGQMYDCYLDPNACLYGLQCAGEPLHIMYNPVTGMSMVVNNTFITQRNLMLEIKAFTMKGQSTTLAQVFIEAGPSSVQYYVPLKEQLDKMREKEGVFLSMRLLNMKRQPVSENLYWLPDATGNHSGLQHIETANVLAEAKQTAPGKTEVTIANPPGAPVAFFIRLSLTDAQTKKRLLPVFYSSNYVSVLPGEKKTLTLEYSTQAKGNKPLVCLFGWNVKEQYIAIETAKPAAGN